MALRIFKIFYMNVHHYNDKKCSRRFFIKIMVPEMWGKGVKNEVFGDFLKNDCNDLVHSPGESRYYESKYVC